MHPFLKFLDQRLADPLPGKSAQMKMAPTPVGNNPGPDRLYNPPRHATSSSVLVPFVENGKGQLELILTLRSSKIRHGGQISFPGGRQEKGETNTQTALRETHEEIGIPSSHIKVLGCMSELYINKSNSHVTPVVGVIDKRPEMHLDPQEVEEAFYIRFTDLLDDDLKEVEEWELHTYTYHVPYWKVHHVPLWGATAMMLSELVELYREFSASGG